MSEKSYLGRNWKLILNIVTLAALVLLVYMILFGLYIGQDIIEPLGFAFLFALFSSSIFFTGMIFG